MAEQTVEAAALETSAAPPPPGPTQTTLEKMRGEQGMTLDAMQRAGFTTAGAFALLQRGAKMLAESDLMPDTYKGKIGNCALVLEMAQRLGASPLLVAQNLYPVHGRPAWSSQFLIACVNQCGRYSAIRYEWVGAPGSDDWGCRAWAIDLATKERAQGPLVTIRIAKKEGWYDRKGSKWQTLPELMLMYRAATFFARTNAPELTMGLPTREEREDTIDLDQVGPGTYAIADLQRAAATGGNGDSKTVEGPAPVTAATSPGPTIPAASVVTSESRPSPAATTPQAPPDPAAQQANAPKPGNGSRFSF